MEAGKHQEAENSLVLSFLAVRQALGVLGLALPSILLAYGWLSGNGLEPSISDFYHTPMGDILVGVLCAIGVFLFTYTGYDPRPGEWLSDRWVSRAAGAAAIGVALFPVAPRPDKACTLPACPVTGLTEHPSLAHFGSAGAFFLCLALFCLVLFPRSGEGPVSARKQRDNRIYRACGIVILVSLALLVLAFVAVRTTGSAAARIAMQYDLIFWIEAIAVIAFGISWLVKGKALAGLRRVLDQTTDAVIDPPDSPGKGSAG